jgi:acyl carrier protein
VAVGTDGIRQLVIESAEALELMNEGELSELDSLAMVDLVSELERRLAVLVPLEEIRTDVFVSVDAVTAWLLRLGVAQPADGASREGQLAEDGLAGAQRATSESNG